MICAATRLASSLSSPLRLVDQRELALLGLRRLLDLFGFARDLRRRELPGIRHRQPFADRHRARSSDQSRQPDQQDDLVRRAGAGNAHDQAKVRHEPVVRAEHRRPQVVSRSAPMPRLGVRDVGARCDTRPTARLGLRELKEEILSNGSCSAAESAR